MVVAVAPTLTLAGKFGKTVTVAVALFVAAHEPLVITAL